ncbi:MAG: type I 3-dehydroquinate dehydratase [Leptospira sp.]|nr:type I 3-dehydroquinate dehydratase [Leptospira sp.]
MNKYRIVVTVGENEIHRLDSEIISQIDLIEVRLDLFSKKFMITKLGEKLRSNNLPKIFTYRLSEDSDQKKKAELNFADIKEFLNEFDNQKNFIDVEINRKNGIFRNYKDHNFSIIYSFHDFEKVISLKKMRDRIGKISGYRSGRDILKFAVTPSNANELVDFLCDIRCLSLEYKIAGLAMGPLGIISRIAGDSFGSCFSYCSIGEPRAPGQVSVKTFLKFRKDFQNAG